MYASSLLLLVSSCIKVSLQPPSYHQSGYSRSMLFTKKRCHLIVIHFTQCFHCYLLVWRKTNGFGVSEDHAQIGAY
jgi:hypothetical protein